MVVKTLYVKESGLYSVHLLTEIVTTKLLIICYNYWLLYFLQVINYNYNYWDLSIDYSNQLLPVSERQ